MRRLNTVGKGWEFCHLPKDEFPGAGPGKCWNPITGCPNLAAGKPCSTPDGEPYCYMSNLIKRFPDIHKAEYRFHPDRLKEPFNTKKPSIVAVGTAGDILAWFSSHHFLIDNGEWGLEFIFRQMECTYHYYLFLTQQPEKYLNFKYAIANLYPDSFGIGITVTSLEDINRIEILKKNKKLRYFNGGMAWVIIEPCFFTLEEVKQLPNNIFTGINWVIIGAMTGPGAKKWMPDHRVVNMLINLCVKNEIAVYIKNSLSHYFCPKDCYNDISNRTSCWCCSTKITFPIPKQFPPQIHKSGRRKGAEVNGFFGRIISR